MTWEKIMKNDFKDIDSFIQKMKRINLSAQKTYTDFETEESLEMADLAASIIDMAHAIKALEKMRIKQEELQ
tara:strand:- start:42 stop:257 length:216 start_codon:yes stop_codon:yes gene_type:complete